MKQKSSKWTLRLAGLWNLILGASAVAAGPAAEGMHGDTVRLLGCFWLILGAILLVASADPVRHWLSVLAAASAKLVVPAVMFAFAVEFSPGFLALAAVDFAWVVPLGLVLAAVERQERHVRWVASPEIVKMALRAKTQHGVSLYELSVLGPTMVVFLRQLGCPFCRESLWDLSRFRHEIERQGTTITLVHMADDRGAEKALEHYRLHDLPRVRDAGQSLYRAFGLPAGKVLQLFGLRTWLRVFPLVAKHGMGTTQGNSQQMPGVFIIFHGEVLKAFRHQSVADRPDYLSLASEWDHPIAS